jgi:Tannase and feruloyl esterase.
MRVCAGVLVFAALGAAAFAQGTPASCRALTELKFENVKITAAEHVAPGWTFPKSPFNASFKPAAESHASFCRVALTIDKDIKVEIWLPDIWNHRFEGVGNGGLTGAINYPAMAQAVREGFATASTDTGHETQEGFFDASWAAGHPERVENFAYRAHHLMAVNAKKIITAYYGRESKKNYFTGCSSGGWQALSEAQRYPEDYDGIVAGAPAINFVRLQSLGFVQAWQARRTPKGDLTPAKLSYMAKAMVAQCDPGDGVKDGFITDPRTCKFDWSKLLCKAGDKPDCLTRAQIARAQTLYGPQTTPRGLKLYPGLPLGVASAFGPHSIAPGHDPFKDSMMIQALKQKPRWTVDRYDPDRDMAPIDKELGGMMNATNPDLSAFKAHGGKLLMYHGWADGLLSPYNTLDYYHAVEAKTPDADKFVRLFMVPSMGHCGGGEGPNGLDSNAAIVSWVEGGEAPDEITGYHTDKDGSIGMTRPLCAEPKVAVYKGTGPTDQASSFVCRIPGTPIVSNAAPRRVADSKRTPSKIERYSIPRKR